MPPLTKDQQLKQKILAGRHVAKAKCPYFRRALNSILLRPAPGLGTFGITPRMVVMYDPAVVEQWTVGNIAWVLVHEISHPLRNCVPRQERIGADTFIWNVAHDMEINDDLVKVRPEMPNDCSPDAAERHFKPPAIPGGAVMVPSLIGMPDGHLAEEYYAKLKQMQKSAQAGGQDDKQGGKKKKGKKGAGEGPSDPKASTTPQNPAAGGGWCGSGGGHKNEGEPAEDVKDSSGRQIGRSQAEVKRIARATAEAIREEAQRNRGTVPGGWVRWSDSVLAPPKIPWEQELASSIRGEVMRAGNVDYTYKRVSVRQAALGYGPGRPRMAGMFEVIPKVAVTVDTSGSMGERQLARAVSEIAGILRTTSSDVEFLACDAAVHEARKVRTWQEAAAALKGGGGTDFRPVFEHLSGLPLHDQPDVLVFVTDGMGPAPELEPQGYRTIWVLVGPYRQAPCTWGKVIEIDDEERQEDAA